MRPNLKENPPPSSASATIGPSEPPRHPAATDIIGCDISTLLPLTQAGQRRSSLPFHLFDWSVRPFVLSAWLGPPSRCPDSPVAVRAVRVCGGQMDGLPCM